MTPKHVIAVEGGATRGSAGAYAPGGRLLETGAGGPCNPVAQGMEAAAAELARLAAGLRDALPPDEPWMLAAGVSGVWDARIRDTLARHLARRTGAAAVRVTDDFHPLAEAALGDGPGVFVIAGTGSKLAGQDGRGNHAHAGGRGSAFSEAGSAYHVARRALQAAARAVDGAGPETHLVAALPAAAGLGAFEELVGWANAAPKHALAALARAVCICAEEGDPVARDVLEGQAAELARFALALFHRLGLPEDAPVHVHGGMFARCAPFARAFEEAVAAYTGCRVLPVAVPGHRAVYDAALREPLPAWFTSVEALPGDAAALPPTERWNDGEAPLDRLPPLEIVQRMHAADRTAVEATGAASEAIARAVEAAAATLAAGGRIIYAGAGTSGRLGVLDAAECPPTFGVEQYRVVALLAGGDRAQRNSVEGAEDDADQGRADLMALAPGPRDIAVGIAASGTTPYVHGALAAARDAGARTVLVCCNPGVTAGADIVIALDTGPEVLPGSTRLKAGTATKLVLNMISTGAMARAGYVYEGLMTGVRPVNAKLRRRAARIVAALTGRPEDEAAALLEAAGNEIAVAVVMDRKGVAADAARARVRAAGGNLRAALEDGADPGRA